MYQFGGGALFTGLRKASVGFVMSVRACGTARPPAGWIFVKFRIGNLY